MKAHQISRRQQQRGAVLIVSLIMLLIMTLIGVTAMQTTTLEERMAGNMRDRNLALQSAEAALRDAEQYLRGIPNMGVLDGSGGLYDIADAGPSDYFSSSEWSTSNSRSYSGTISGIAAQPRYIIKAMTIVEPETKELNIKGYGTKGSSGNTVVFRIVARGVGGSNRSQVFLRSHFARTF